MKYFILYLLIVFFGLSMICSCKTLGGGNELNVDSNDLSVSSSKRKIEERGQLNCLNDTIYWYSEFYDDKSSPYFRFSSNLNCVLEGAFYGSAQHIDFLKFYFSTVDYKTSTISRHFESKESTPEWRYRGRELFEAFLYNLASNHVCDEGCKSEIYLLILMDMVKEIEGYSSFRQTIDSMQLEVREGYGCECKQWELTEGFIRKNYESGKITLKDFGEF